MSQLSLHQRGLALDAIGKLTLTLHPGTGNWVATLSGVKIERGRHPVSIIAGHNAEHALEQLWKRAEANVLFIESTKRKVRWNGFMWSDAE